MRLNHLTPGAKVHIAACGAALAVITIGALVRSAAPRAGLILMLMGFLIGAVDFMTIALLYRDRPFSVAPDGVLRCGLCRYPVEQQFTRCPECGRDLLAPYGAVLGVPETFHSTWWMMFGIGLVMLASGIFLGYAWWP